MSMMLKHAVDEAFARMASLYGREFTAKFVEGEDIDAVKAAWTHELAMVPLALDRIAWALKHLPERAPNAITFRNLCLQAPNPRQVVLELPDAPVRGPTQAELDSLRQLRDTVVFKRPGKQWAHDIAGAFMRGDYHGSACALRMAMSVVPVPDGPPVEAMWTDEPMDLYQDPQC